MVLSFQSNYASLFNYLKECIYVMGWSGKSPKMLQMLALITGGICFTTVSRYLLVSISSPCENIYQEVVTVLIVWNSKAHICFVQNCNCHCFSISLFAAGDASLPWKKKDTKLCSSPDPLVQSTLACTHTHTRTHKHVHTCAHTHMHTHRGERQMQYLTQVFVCL